MNLVQTINTNAPHALWVLAITVIATIVALSARRWIPSRWSRMWTSSHQDISACPSRPVPWDPQSVAYADDEVTQQRRYTLPPVPVIPRPPRLPSDTTEWSEARSGVRARDGREDSSGRKVS